MHFVRAGAALLLSIPLAARAAPGWSNRPDAADERGHSFICAGEGKSEDDALATALGICNDKICKVCGVEVESTVVTKETLQGVDLVRKVVERCRRVRKSELQIKSKSLECDDGKCQAWVQIFYSKEDEKAECPSYAREDFPDPAACEADVEAFRRQQGRTAASMRERRSQLDAALAHCANIDVRPTPALMAIDEKLRVGVGQFSPTGGYAERLADAFLVRPGQTMQAFAETRTLAGRLTLLRDLVANKALVLDVVEAAEADDFDTTESLAHLLAVLKAAPLGSQYGAPDVHFAMTWVIARARSDTTALADFYRTSYLPERPLPEMRVRDWEEISVVLAADGKATPAEWDWAMRATRAGVCSRCLSSLIRARDHGGEAVRLARFFEGLQAVRESNARQVQRHPEYGLHELLPLRDPTFVLQVEEQAPAEWKPRFDYELYKGVAGSFEDTQPEADQARVLLRLAETAALTPPKDDHCFALSKRIEFLREAGAPLVPALGEAVCACLSGPFAERRRDDKKELLQAALDHRLACVEKP